MTQLSDSNDWSLNRNVFARWHRLYRFDVDGAASKANAQLPTFWTKRMDAFKQNAAGLHVYTNHPYSEGECEKWHSHARNQVLAGPCPLWACHSPNHSSEGWFTRNVMRAPEGLHLAHVEALSLPGFANGYRRVWPGLAVDLWFYEGRQKHRERTGATGSARFPNAFVVYAKPEHLPRIR